jgi:hypothetical protein
MAVAWCEYGVLFGGTLAGQQQSMRQTPGRMCHLLGRKLINEGSGMTEHQALSNASMRPDYIINRVKEWLTSLPDE